MAADSIKHNANRFYAIYDSHMGVSMYDRTHMMRSFEKALKDGEFEVYFQPQIRTCTGKVCGLEALSRWHDSEKGLLMPGEYIPMLEETGLISRLDYYVAEKAIQRIVWHLKTDGRALPVSINLSRVDFDVSDPVMEVERLVQVYDCPRHLLHIEVTESALVQDYGRLKQGLHDFQEAGYDCCGALWKDILHVARGAIKTGADGRLALEKDGNPARLRVRILERGKGMALGKAELVDL